MRRALEARAVVAQVAEQKEAGRAALAAAQVITAPAAAAAPASAAVAAALLHSCVSNKSEPLKQNQSMW